MVLCRGNRLAVHSGDGAAFDDEHLQVRVQACKLANHSAVVVPVATSDLAANILGKRNGLDTGQRRDNRVQAVREVVLAMGSIVCPATRTTTVDLREHGHESQLIRR
jgi:hypothetical protein